MFIKKFVLPPIETNSYLIVEGREAIVIDPASGSADNVMKELQRQSAKLSLIINTHGHWDHIIENQLLHKKTKAPIACHPMDEKMLLRPDAMGLKIEINSTRPHKHLLEGNIVVLGEKGKQKFRVIHTPGHTPGGICLYDEKEKILFSGDTLFAGTYGRIDLKGADPEKMRESLKKLMKLPPETIVLPGHGEKTTIGEEKKWLEKV